MIIRHQHIYATTLNGQILCATGARIWFKEYGLSWSDFIQNGISADEVLKIGDAYANAVVETAKKMEIKT